MTKTERNILIGCAVALVAVVAWRVLRKPEQREQATSTPGQTLAAQGIATYAAYTPFGVVDIPFAQIADDGHVQSLENVIK